MKVRVQKKKTNYSNDKPEILHDFFDVFLRLICSCALTFGLLFSFFLIASNTGSVAVEITEIPNNWLVKTFVEGEGDSSTVGSGLRGKIRQGDLAITMDQSAILFGTRNSDGGMITFDGTFQIDNRSFSNAYILIEPQYLAGISLSGLEYYITRPIIKFSPVCDTNDISEVEVHAGITGDSVEQHISVDFDSYLFEFLSTGLNQASYEDKHVLSGDITITASSKIAISFEDCVASIVVGDEKVPITNCVYHFDNASKNLVLGSNEQTQEGYTYYKFQMPRQSDFSISSSSFAYMDLWGIGNMYFLYTAKDVQYELHDQEVNLTYKDSESINDNMYTFEHSYDIDEAKEKNLFRLTAYVSEASIAGESVIPNFRTWFRETILNNPPMLVSLVVTNAALFSFIGRKRKQTSD